MRLSLSSRQACLFIFLISLLFYGISAGVKIFSQSETPHYVYLADAFLHGKTHLVHVPHEKLDLIFYNGKWYVIGGISPALLMLPFVAFFGVSFSDVFFGVLIGALNVTMMYSLLEHLVENASARVWLIIFFAANTAHWALASVGSVWLNAQLTALLFMILFARGTLQGKTWQAGVWLGLAALARPPIITAALFYVALSLLEESDWKPALKKLLPFGLTLAACFSILLAYNQLRFGSPLEFGYGYLKGTKSLTDTFNKSGGFNVKYMPCNMYVSLLGTPNMDIPFLPRVNEVCSYLNPINQTFGKASQFFNPLGMSMFIVSPVLLLIFRASLREKKVIAAWVGLFGVILPIWMYHATGWVQFGYRFATDFMVFLIILLSYAIRRVGWLEKTSIIVSVIMGGIGLYLIYYSVFGLFWNKMFVEMLRKIYHFIF